MQGSKLIDHLVEPYVTSQLTTGYYLLASDRQGRWYWAPAHGPDLDQVFTADFEGPFVSRGEAIMAGEDWVEASTAPHPPCHS